MERNFKTGDGVLDYGSRGFINGVLYVMIVEKGLSCQELIMRLIKSILYIFVL